MGFILSQFWRQLQLERRKREMVRPGASADVCSGLLTQLCNGSLQVQTFGRNLSLQRQNKNIPPACHLVKPTTLSS